MFYQACLSIQDTYTEYVPLYIVTPPKINYIYKEEKKMAFMQDIGPTVLYTSGIKFNYLSDGQNLLKPETLTGDITYRGKSFKRDELFKSFVENNTKQSVIAPGEKESNTGIKTISVEEKKK